jgi:hypothetical protein
MRNGKATRECVMQLHGRLLLALCTVLAAGGFLQQQAAPARADGCVGSSYLVSLATDINPPDDHSLRWALNCANETSGATIDIQFSSGPTNTIPLLQGPLVATSNMAIVGPGSAALLIDGNGASSVVEVSQGATVAISGLTIELGGTSGSQGGGIRNAGSLTTNDVTVTASTAANGGGIYNTGTLNVSGSSTVADNTATADGGGIYNTGTLNVSGGSVIGVGAGGVGAGNDFLARQQSKLARANAARHGTGALSRPSARYSSITHSSSAGGAIGNHANGNGGGIYNAPGGVVVVDGSAVSGNNAVNGAGIYNAGTLTGRNLSAIGGDLPGLGNSATGNGGGIDNESPTNLTIIDLSIVSGNQATASGGGIYNDAGPLSIAGSLIGDADGGIGNAAGIDGGGLYNVSGVVSVDQQQTLSPQGSMQPSIGPVTYSSEITGNSAVGNGGGVFSGGTLTVAGGSLIGYDAVFGATPNFSANGGGIYNTNVLRVTGGSMIGSNDSAAYNDPDPAGYTPGNVAAENGGGIYNSQSGSLTLSNGTVFLNLVSAANLGDVVAQTPRVSSQLIQRLAGTTNLSSAAIRAKLASLLTTGPSIGAGGGGGIYNAGGLVATDTLVVTNTVALQTGTGLGGGILNDGGIVTLTGPSTKVQGNDSGMGLGGGIFNDGGIGSSRPSASVTGSTPPGTLTIDGAQVLRNAANAGGGVFNYGGIVFPSGTLTGTAVLEHGALVASNAAEFGGGIANGGPLSLSGSSVLTNTALGGGGIANVGHAEISGGTNIGDATPPDDGNFAVFGGGILNFGSMTIGSSNIIANTAGAGAGVFNTTSQGSFSGFLTGTNLSGTVTLDSSVVRGNHATYLSTGTGGGFYNQGTLAISRSTLDTNTADGPGGGIVNDSSAAESAGAPLLAAHAAGLTLASSGVGFAGIVTIDGSTMSGNSSVDASGGAVFNLSVLTITNSTLVANTAHLEGGAILGALASTTIGNSTLTGNSAGAAGGAIARTTGAGVLLAVHSSIVYGNTLTGLAAQDCSGTIQDLGHNLEGSNGGCGFAIQARHGNPQLQPLALNAPGTTMTMALGTGSDAIGYGECTGFVLVDQRGAQRKPSCDIGAYETAPVSQPAPPPALLPQVIVFGVLPGPHIGDAPFTITATGGGSGNPVIFTAGGACSSSGSNGSVITYLAVGNCVITANQAGGNGYAPALPATAQIVVAPIVPSPTPSPTATASPTVTATATPALPPPSHSSSQFYFAGGVSTSTEHAYLHLLNPGNQAAQASLTFYYGDGQTNTAVVTVAPASAKVVSVSSLETFSGDFALGVAADQSIGAELVLSRDNQDGDVIPGNAKLANTWYLAEGMTNISFHESLAILNPSATDTANITLHFLPTSGATGAGDVQETVPPHSQIVVNADNLTRVKQSMGLAIASSTGVVVERSLTFGTKGYGLTAESGTARTATRWSFASGTTVKPVETWLLVANANARAAHVTARFYGPTGSLLATKTAVVPGGSRQTWRINDFLSSSRISSVVASDLPVVAEQAEYSNAPNKAPSPGSALFGSMSDSSHWLFADGDTTAGKSNESLQLFNPGSRSLTIGATFFGTDGTIAKRQIALPAHSSLDVGVNQLLPAGFSPLHGVVLAEATGRTYVAEQTIADPGSGTKRSTTGVGHGVS